jgi:hypothetical protein
MAVITLNATYPKIWLRQQLETVFFACHKKLDTFVSGWIRHAAGEAEHHHPRRHRQSRHPNTLADESETVLVQFGPLDPNVLSEAIPAFFIGRNNAGLWVAREAKGRIGGIFLLKSSAVSFARAQSETAGCATIFPAERFELDLSNHGNPFAIYLAVLMQFAASLSRQVGRIGEAIIGAARNLLAH